MVNFDDLIGDSHEFFSEGLFVIMGPSETIFREASHGSVSRMFSHPWRHHGAQCHAHEHFESQGPTVNKALWCTASQPYTGFVFRLMQASKTPLPNRHHNTVPHKQTESQVHDCKKYYCLY